MKKLLFIIIFVSMWVGGCQKKQVVVDDVNVSGPKVVAVPQDIVPAVERVGGLESWANTEMIAGECTYTVYKEDGTKYVTSQRHAVFPWSDTIRVYAAEPEGQFAWSLFREDFQQLEGPSVNGKEPHWAINNRYIVESIWSILAPPARIAALSDEDSKLGERVLVNGLWYSSIELPGDRIYFLNVSTGIIDMCLVPAQGRFFLARGYNYSPTASTLISLPRKIEVFESDRQGRILRRIIEIDYSHLDTSAF